MDKRDIQNMVTKNIETRTVDSIRALEKGRTVEGYALRFNSDSHDIGWIERLMPDCITEELIQNSDVFAKLDHRDDVILARSKYGKGSLQLELREDGLFYRFEAPNTIWGDELLEHIRRGEITTSSFAFWVEDSDDAEKWYTDENNQTRRDIYKIGGLVDVSPVYSEAYPTTSVTARDKAQALKEAKQKQLIEKYDQMLKDLDII